MDICVTGVQTGTWIVDVVWVEVGAGCRMKLEDALKVMDTCSSLYGKIRTTTDSKIPVLPGIG